MKAPDKSRRTLVRHNFAGDAYHDALRLNIVYYHRGYTYNTLISDMDTANDFCIVADAYSIAYAGIFKTRGPSIGTNFAIQPQQDTDRNVTINSNLSGWIYNYGTVMAYCESWAYIGRPRNLESVFYRIVTQCKSTEKKQWLKKEILPGKILTTPHEKRITESGDVPAPNPSLKFCRRHIAEQVSCYIMPQQRE